MNEKIILDLLAEAGMLKRIKRSGWWMIGIPFEESVAEHSFRCAMVGYCLAKMEKVDPYKVVMMSLFGDLHEARINDQHKVASRYLNTRDAEKKAFEGQIERLDKNMRSELASMRLDYDKQNTKEALIARDADILECILQAKEYVDLGFSTAKKFFRAAPKHLKTKSAKGLYKKLSKWNSNKWWESLSEFKR
ncbi:MAG TPA: HD domain-containing protein [Candidatus Omnitrophota bacterium]|nr:HD domain-containing protein [Candidatus Omnitrophota bacterium]HPS20915.1 HD domain-containing protein [Candidatus Omnitrophota bacterium]